MKRYISAILIPCLLLQLGGCYSFRVISIQELKNYKGTNEIKVTKESDYFTLMQRDSTESYITDWQVNDSSIIIEKKTLTQSNNAQNPEEMKSEIKFNQIKSVGVEEFDSENTVVLVVSLVALGAMIALAIYGSIHSAFTNGTLNWK
jgi:hypothetical protein